MRLSVRLLLLFVILTTVPLAVVGIIAYVSGQRTIEQSTFGHLTAVNALKEASFERWIAYNERVLAALAQQPSVRAQTAVLAAAAEPAETQAARESLLQDHLAPSIRELGSYEVLSILASDGLILVSTAKSLEGKYRESEPFFIHGKLGVYTGDVEYLLSEGQAVMHVSAPIYDPQGSLVAVLAGHVDLAEMSAIIGSQSDLHDSEDTYLVNAFNFYVTEPRFGHGYALHQAVYSQGVDDCLQEMDGRGYYADYRGQAVMGVYRWLPERRVCILTELDQAEAFAPVAALRNSVLAVGLISSAACALLGAIVARSITGPVGQLAAGAEQIGRGNLAHRVRVKTRDELGQLAQGFNRMAIDLQASLGETTHSRQLVIALGQVAQAVQRAHTDAEVWRELGREIRKLGLHAVAFEVSLDRTYLTIPFLTFESGLLQTAEKMVGLTHQEYKQSIDPGSTYERVIAERRAIFVASIADPLRDSLPRAARPLAERIIDLLGIRQGIYAPLTADEEVIGILLIVGPSLAEIDIQAISAFANQAAIALENARLYQEIRQHAVELEQRVTERTQELNDARIAALNMMEDAEEARRESERANEVLVHEIEQRQRTERELARSNQELEQFAYVASHDLQEPLRAISGYLQLLQRRYAGQLDDKAEQYITRSVDAATRMKAMIEDLLAFSRVGTRGRSFEPTDLAAVLRKTLANLQSAIDESGAAVTADPLPTVMADGSQMLQLLQNLIGNAIKFSGDRRPEIHVSATQTSEVWRVSVRDNGIGIDAAYHDRIFVIFQRLHTRAEYAGTGIGLAICRRIVERHGGRIWVESEAGVGSTFYWTIPANAGEIVPATVDRDLEDSDDRQDLQLC